MRRYPNRKNLRTSYRRRVAPGGLVRDASFEPEPLLLALPAPAAPPPEQARRRRWSFRRVALIAVPVVLVVLAAIFVLPVVLAARQAYNNVFVTPAPRPRIALNAQGAPVIVDTNASPVALAAIAATPNASPIATPIGTPLPAVQLPDWDNKDRVNILLLGADATDPSGASRSDTIILVSINPATKQVGMLSIPRDLLVAIPNYGNDKINAAYAYGSTSKWTGPGLMIATIEYNFGIPIHYYVEVDFAGFQKIVDTMGGVTIDVPTPIKDDEYPANDFNYTRVLFHTGLQHMDGKTALHYARTRHDDNDFARGERQQQVLEALRQQGVQLGLLSKAPQLLESAGDTFHTDLSPRQALALAKLGASIEPGSIHSYSLLSVTTAQWLTGQPYYLIPDWNGIHAILNDMMSH